MLLKLIVISKSHLFLLYNLNKNIVTWFSNNANNIQKIV